MNSPDLGKIFVAEIICGVLYLTPALGQNLPNPQQMAVEIGSLRAQMQTVNRELSEAKQSYLSLDQRIRILENRQSATFHAYWPNDNINSRASQVCSKLGSTWTLMQIFPSLEKTGAVNFVCQNVVAVP